MITIYKYQLTSQDEHVLKIPSGGKILSVQVQGNVVCMWVKVDTSEPLEDRHIYIFGTGHELPEEYLKFIDTFQLYNGSAVFHVFEGE